MCVLADLLGGKVRIEATQSDVGDITEPSGRGADDGGVIAGSDMEYSKGV